MIVRRGFRAPPSYHIDRLREAPAGHYFDVMTNGFGAMASYANRVEVADRWAIVAYIRALQLSQNARLEDVPADERDKLQAPDARVAVPGDQIDIHTSASTQRAARFIPAEFAVTTAGAEIGSNPSRAATSNQRQAAEPNATCRECDPAGINPAARLGETIDRIQDSSREATP
jgi:hypothetical protein